MRTLVSSEGRLLLALLVVALCVWAFIALAGVVNQGALLEIEERWLRALRDPSDPAKPAGPWWLADMARDISALGGATVVVLLSLFTATYLLIRGRWRRVLLLALTIGGGYGLSSFLKVSYDRERPDVVPHLVPVHSASFPSGHSLSSSVVYLTIGVLLAQAATRRREKFFFIAAAFALTALIGASRVFLGVHYPTDVLAGWCAGIAWALGCGLVADRVQRRWAKPPPQEPA